MSSRTFKLIIGSCLFVMFSLVLFITLRVMPEIVSAALVGERCEKPSDCRSWLCEGGTCVCRGQGESCSSSVNCCTEVCDNGTCACTGQGSSCSADRQCCSGACGYVSGPGMICVESSCPDTEGDCYELSYPYYNSDGSCRYVSLPSGASCNYGGKGSGTGTCVQYNREMVCMEKTTEETPAEEACPGTNLPCQVCARNQDGECICNINVGVKCGAYDTGTCRDQNGRGVCVGEKSCLGPYDKCGSEDTNLSCCSNLYCGQSYHALVCKCQSSGMECDASKVCCKGYDCVSGRCVQAETDEPEYTCNEEGEKCASDDSCCSDVCINNICTSCETYCKKNFGLSGTCVPDNKPLKPTSGCTYYQRCYSNIQAAKDPRGYERPWVYCASSDYDCYCYSTGSEKCSPACTQRCKADGCAPLEPEKCCNNIDDDGDQAIDGRDPDCQKESPGVSLSAGKNEDVCWWRLYPYTQYNKREMSKVFSCPEGSWAKVSVAYGLRSFEDLYIKDGNTGKSLRGYYGNSRATNAEGIYPTDKIYLEFVTGSQSSRADSERSIPSSEKGVKLNYIECIAPQTLGCNMCGKTGIFYGVTNRCDQEECASLGDCYFQKGWGGIVNYCYSKVPVEFTVHDAITKAKLMNVKVTAAGQSCITGEDGSCSMDLGLGAELTAEASGAGYICKGDKCPLKFKISSNPYEVVLEINEEIPCSDSDTTFQYPSGMRNYYEKGTIRETYGIFNDECRDDKKLTEYYCAGDKSKSETYTCAIACQNGACLKVVEGVKARVTFNVVGVSDSGYERPSAGTTVIVERAGENCITEHDGRCAIEMEPNKEYTARIRDAMTGGDPFVICDEALGCPVTFTAQGRDDFVTIKVKTRPLMFDSCFDSDKGNYYKKGAVKDARARETHVTTFIDYCFRDGKKMMEGLCRNRSITTEIHECEYGCVDGACVQPQGVRFYVYNANNEDQKIEGALVKALRPYAGRDRELGSCTTDDRGRCEIDIVGGTQFYSSVEKEGYRCEKETCYRSWTAEEDLRARIGLQSDTVPIEGRTCEDCGMFCTQAECLALGDCVFTNKPFPLPNECKTREIPPNEMTQNFIVYDAHVKEESGKDQPVEGVKVEVQAAESEEVVGTCNTNVEGTCGMHLLFGNSYKAFVSANKYVEQGPLPVTPASKEEPAIIIYLMPKSAVKCSDSDAEDPFPDGSNYYTRGEVVDREGTHTDQCSTDSVLSEATCADNLYKAKAYSCRYGCGSGTCRIRAVFRVKDGGTNEALANAKVDVIPYTEDTTLSCSTNEAGECFIDLPSSFDYKASVSPEGYQKYEKGFTVISPFPESIGVPPRVIVELKPSKAVVGCADCGKGIANFCDEEECLALGDCVHVGRRTCLTKTDWNLLLGIRNKILSLENRIEAIRNALPSLDLTDEQVREIEQKLEGVEERLEDIKKDLPESTSSQLPWKELFRKFLLVASALAADLNLTEINNELNSLDSDIAEIENELPTGGAGQASWPSGEGKSYYLKLINPIEAEDLAGLIKRISNWLLGIAGSVMVIVLIFAGFKYMTAGGSEEKAQQAKTMFKWSLIGVAIVIGAAAIVNGLFMALGTKMG